MTALGPDFISLQVRDLEASAAFYTEHLGLVRAPVSPEHAVRALLARYATATGLEHNMPPHRLRHFLFTWLKTQGIDDALIQPYSERPRQSTITGDLQPPRPHRRTKKLRRRHHPLPYLTPNTLPLGSRSGVPGQQGMHLQP